MSLLPQMVTHGVYYQRGKKQMNLLNYKWWKQFLVGNYYEFVFRVVHKSKWKQVGSFKQRSI